MRFPIIFTLLLFVGAAHALPFSEWTDNQAAGKCTGDLRRAYGDTLSVVSFMGKQPHEDNTTLVGLVASDGRTEYRGQQVVVGCIYKQDASLITIFFNSKIANWTAPKKGLPAWAGGAYAPSTKRATAPAKRPAPQSASTFSTGGYPLSIPSDPKAQYNVLGKGGTHNNPTLVTKRIGPSGTSYSEWLFDCSASKAKYLGHGDTLEEMQASSPYNSEMGPIVEESITWYAWRHACTNTSVQSGQSRASSPPESDASFGVGTYVVFVIVLLAYFLPSVIAGSKEHHQGAAIFALNLFLGWTFLGWVVALVWSLTATQGASTKK